jgi:hypothetical protein
VGEEARLGVRYARVWSWNESPPSYTAWGPIKADMARVGMVMAAGRLAEELWGIDGPPPLQGNLDGGCGCAGDFCALAVRLTDEDDSPALAWLKGSLAVKAYWERTGGRDRVLAIARQLSLKGRLLGSEIEAIREKAGDTSVP